MDPGFLPDSLLAPELVSCSAVHPAVPWAGTAVSEVPLTFAVAVVEVACAAAVAVADVCTTDVEVASSAACPS